MPPSGAVDRNCIFCTQFSTLSTGGTVRKLVRNALARWAGVAVPPELEDVVAELAKLRGEMANLQLQWAEVLDKITAWGNCVAARERQRVKRALEDVETVEAEGDDLPPSQNVSPQPPGPLPGRSNKADLYARMNARLRR